MTAGLLPAGWTDWPDTSKQQLLKAMAGKVVAMRLARWRPYPWQVPPRALRAQEMFLCLGGRGVGKTDGASRYVTEHIAGPPCDPRIKGGHRIAIVAPTLGDAVESCVDGPSGLRAHDHRVQLIGGLGGSHVRFPGGAQGKLFGAFTPEDVERLRSGGNRCLVWIEELAAMRRLAGVLEHTRLGLRIGATPHYVASTTPKPRKELRELIADPRTLLTHGRTSQAYHLDAAVRAVYDEMYAGTRLGRQELEGEMLDDVEGALWAWWMFDVDGFRVDLGDVGALELDRVVVSVDPATTSGEHSDSSGLVVAGRGRPPGMDRTVDGRPRGYVLHSQSVRMTPEKTMQEAVRLFHRWEADCIVIEANNGGDYLPAVLRQVDPGVPVRLIHASRGKRTRAEPVSALYEQARVSHVGMAASFLSLEDQLTSWTGESGQDSPDEMDALCHAMHDLLVTQAPASTGQVRDRRFAGRR